MKLFTKDYLRFQVHDDGQCIKEFTGIEQAAKALPGDQVTADGALLIRTEHPPLVGVVHLQSKTKYGITTRGYPIYLFEPLNKAYPLMIVGCSENSTSNMIGLAKFESWSSGAKYPRANLIRLLGPCGDPEVEAESLILRYSPWPYPKAATLSPNYESELLKRPMIQGYTFNIDPPGCEDVDDVFSIEKYSDIDTTTWHLTISITDVATAIEEGSPLDIHSKRTGQSLYPLGSEPKHMLPPSISTLALSLGPNRLRNCISLRMIWSEDLSEILSSEIILAKTLVNKAYTYREAQEERRHELQILKKMVNRIANRPVETSEEWVETLMIHYNNEIGKYLKSHKTGILRSHAKPDEEKIRLWTAIDPCLEKLAYSAATYCSSSSELDSMHWGLGLTDYTHASSPLRRYADLYNQRCVLAVIHGMDTIYPSEELCKDLNTLGKNAKSFERDMFFLEALSEDDSYVTGTVVEIKTKKLQIWVPAWNRLVNVKNSDEPVEIGDKVSLDYYVQYQNARWKDRIVFSVSLFN